MKKVISFLFWIGVIFLFLLLMGCSHSVCKAKIKMVKKEIKHGKFYR